MYVSPKIIVFTKNKEDFAEYNKEFLNINNKFYTFGGIVITFENVKRF